MPLHLECEEPPEHKIIGVVKQMEAGRPIEELARELEGTDQTLHAATWHS